MMYEDFNIQSLKWIDAEQTAIDAVVNGKRSTVPADPDNRHYKYILDNALVIDPYVAPPLLVEEVSKYQFMKQAKASAQFATIKAWYDGLADDDEAKIEFQYSDHVNRDGPFVAGVKTLLGLSDAQVQTFMNNASAVA